MSVSAPSTAAKAARILATLVQELPPLQQPLTMRASKSVYFRVSLSAAPASR